MENSLRAQLAVLGLTAEYDPLTVDSVNKKFLQMAKECHPDRFPEATPGMKAQLEQQFSALKSARDFFMDWFEAEYLNMSEDQKENLKTACYDWANEALFQRDHRALTGPENEKWAEKNLTVKYRGQVSNVSMEITMPVCKWIFYAPCVLTYWDVQHLDQTITEEFQRPEDAVVDLELTPLSKSSFWSILSAMIGEYEKPKAEFYRPVPIWEKFYAVIYWSGKKYAVGFARFLIALSFSDEVLCQSVCGDGFKYRLHPEASVLYGSIIRDCLAQHRISAAQLILGRLHLLAQFPEAVLRSYDCTSVESRRAFKLHFRHVVRAEKHFLDQRHKETEIVRCSLYVGHFYAAVEAGDHLEQYHPQDIAETGWRRCVLDSRCIWNNRSDPHHFIKCPYRVRPILEDTGNAKLKEVIKPTVRIIAPFLR